MTPAADRLLTELLQLATEDHSELASRLLDSLDAETDADAQEAWAKEIRARIEDVRSGRVQTVPWADARRQILADDEPTPPPCCLSTCL